jgi:hypothetical protein
MLSSHALELALFLLVHELTGLFAALRLVLLSHDLCFNLGALSNSCEGHLSAVQLVLREKAAPP